MRHLPIIFSPHAEESMHRRGATPGEVEQVIRDAEWREAKQGRFEAKQRFKFSAEWNHRFYQDKEISPVFVLEDERIIVITVYVFYS